MATTSGINTSMFTVDSNGKLNVGGIASGINSKAIIDALMQARRQPAVQLEAKVTTNSGKISALGDFKTQMNSVVTSLDKLRANPGSTTNVFNSKSVTGTTTAVSGTASDIDSLMIATVGTEAQNMTHTLKVRQLATAHQVRSDAVTSTTAALSTLGVTPGTMSIGGKDITISSSDTLMDLRSKINNSGAGVTATIVSSDASTHYLVLTSNKTGAANAMTFGGDTNLTDGLGFTENAGADIKTELAQARNAIIDVDGIEGIERASNSVDDVLAGVTLSLLKAEPGTTITLKVEPDLGAIKTAIFDFVQAYNSVRDFATAQRTASDRNDDGTIGSNEVGAMAYDQLLRDALSQLSTLVATSVDGAPDGFASLGQMGVVLGSDYKLTIDDTILDNKLLTNVDGVKNLFAFSSTVSDSRVTVLQRGTSSSTGDYVLNITGTDASGNVTGATWNGQPMTVSGRTLTAPDGTTIFFNGGADLGAVNGINVSMSRGVADQFYDYFSELTKTGVGTIDTQVMQLQTQNTDYKDRVTLLDERLTLARTNLEAKYAAMEVALAKLQTLQQTIDSYTKSLNGNSN
ncbi:MAG: hypothetical protein EON60_00845 [Alphaproteobacteria bacterium]|nr:MAG: hypothetical protein EON60_00845 [Alphaproteobacteria bacterium]